MIVASLLQLTVKICASVATALQVMRIFSLCSIRLVTLSLRATTLVCLGKAVLASHG